MFEPSRSGAAKRLRHFLLKAPTAWKAVLLKVSQIYDFHGCAEKTQLNHLFMYYTIHVEPKIRGTNKKHLLKSDKLSRKEISMEWNEKPQVIIDYVENHLQQKEELINSEEISKIAECFFSFFQKVFSYMNGIRACSHKALDIVVNKQGAK